MKGPADPASPPPPARRVLLEDVLFGLAFAAAAVGLRVALAKVVQDKLIYGTITIAMAVLAAWRGWRAALVCLLAATPPVVALYVIHDRVMNYGDWLGLVSFLIITGCITVLADRSRRAFFRMKAEADAAKRADAAHRESEQRYRQLVESSPDAVFVTVDHRIVYANEAMERLFGVSSAELIGRDARAMAQDGTLAHLEQGMGHSRLPGQPQAPVEERWKKPDGGVLVCEAVAAPVPWKGSTGIQRILRDIGARKQAEERLEHQARELARSNADLEDFAYIVSHDLKEPLRGIANFAEFLKEDAAEQLSAEDKEKLDTLVRLSVRMHQLLDSLLEYSRAGRAELAVAECDLGTLATQARETLAPWLEGRDAEVRVAADLPRARCDAVRVVQVFANLITNAVKYNDSSPRRVEIGARLNGAAPVIYVRDNGIGIADRHHATIFKMFRRLHPRDRYGGGAGSGLAIVKTIVERHGGRVWVEGRPGEGSTFCFTLGA